MDEPVALRALSFWQPVASLLAWGLIHTETRTWRMQPGPLVIHAAKSRAGLAWADQPAYRELIEQYDLDLTGLTFGAAIAVGEVWDVMPADEYVPFGGDYDELDWRLGDFSPGRWCFQFMSVWQLPRPVPVTGRQGVWTVPEPAAESIRAQFSQRPSYFIDRD